MRNELGQKQCDVEGMKGRIQHSAKPKQCKLTRLEKEGEPCRDHMMPGPDRKARRDVC